MKPNINKPVPGAKEFYPLNEPSIGTTMSPVRLHAIVSSDTRRAYAPVLGIMGPRHLTIRLMTHLFRQETFPRNKTLPPLFESLTIRGVTFPNRIFVVRSLRKAALSALLTKLDFQLRSPERSLVADVPVQLGQRPRHRLAHGAYRRAYNKMLLVGLRRPSFGNYIILTDERPRRRMLLGLCDARRGGHRYGSDRGRSRGSHLARGRGALDGLTDRAAQAHRRLCAHAGGKGRRSARARRPQGVHARDVGREKRGSNASRGHVDRVRQRKWMAGQRYVRSRSTLLFGAWY